MKRIARFSFSWNIFYVFQNLSWQIPASAKLIFLQLSHNFVILIDSGGSPDQRSFQLSHSNFVYTVSVKSLEK